MLDSISQCTCGGKFAVVDSRPIDVSGIHSIVRRRKCLSCGFKRHTLEIDRDLALQVLSDD